MSNTKHTPGPWRYQSETSQSFGDPVSITRFEVYTATGLFGHPATCSVEADAKLIASAPELLEALQRLHGILSQTVFYDSYPELIEPTESAIEKATN